MASVISIGTSTTPLLDSTGVVDPATDAVTRAVLSETSIVTELMMIEQSSLAHKVQAFYDYGRDTYSDGLPVAYNWNPVTQRGVYDPSVTETRIADIITALEGEAITIASYDYSYQELGSVVSAEHFYHLYWNVGYNSLTNRVDPTKVRLGSGIFVTSGGVNDTFTVVSTTDIFTGNFVVVYDAVIGGVAKQVTVEYTPTNSIYTTGDMFRVSYTKDSDGGSGRIYWWVYYPAVGEFATLEEVYTPTIQHDYYPIVPVRINTHWVSEDKHKYMTGAVSTPGTLSQFALTSRGALARLDLDIDLISDAIATNDSIADVSDAFVAFTVPLNTDKAAGLLYLYEFFSRQRLDSPVNKTQYEAWRTTDINAPMNTNAYSITVNHLIQDPDYGANRVTPIQYAHLDLRYEYNYIDETTTNGIIGDGTIGNIDSAITLAAAETVDGGIIQNDSIVYRRQTSANTITNITVHGIVLRGNIDTKSNPIDSITYGVAVQQYITTLASVVADSSASFYMPLEKSVVDDVFSGLSLLTEQLFSEGLTLVINAVNETDLEWYQTEGFAFFIKIVGIIISIYTLNPTASALIASASWAAAAYIVAELAIQIILMKLAAEAILWIVEKIGGKYALIIAAVIAVVAITVGVTGIDLTTYLPTATEMLKAVECITQAVNENTLNEAMELQEEMEEFTASTEERQQELDDAQALLDGSDYDFLDIIIQPDVILSESPDDFFNRTIHTGNVGVLSLNAPNDFVSNLLTLPKTI